VISELVGEWRLQLAKWRRMNAAHKTEVDGAPAPSANDEYLLYQILLGSFPSASLPPGGGPGRGSDLPNYTQRIVDYMRKATREAKQRTSWANPNEAYEAATESFVRDLLAEHLGNAFLEDLRASAKPVAWAGWFNSLSMTTVKLTSPGVPDIYQGNEIFDLSLVDPDNRRPVDYELRAAMLRELEALGDSPDLGPMLGQLEEGRAKLYVTWRLLQLRRQREALFRDGGYTAVRTTGQESKHVVAFARRQGGDVLVTVAPRLVAGLGVRPGNTPCDASLWGEARVELPFVEEGTSLRDVFTGRELKVEKGGLGVADVLARFPVAVLARLR